MGSENRLQWFYVFLKGMAMGAADAVPGVSGGTIALITGIYERLINAITAIRTQDIKHILNNLKNQDVDSLAAKFVELDGKFLSVLTAGIITSLLTVLYLVHFLLSNYAIQTYGFFFGLIAASALALYQKIQLRTKKSWFTAITGFIISFMVSGYANASLGHETVILFFSGMIAISAMVLPGISGSLLLVILGQYEYMVNTISSLISSIGEGKIPVETFLPIASFITGAFIGLFTVAHSVKWMLKNHRDATIIFLVSLVAGALRAPIVEVEKILTQQNMTWSNILPEFTATATLGFILVLILDYKADVIQI